MANTKKFVVKNGLHTQNIDFVSPDENSTLTLSMLDSDTISISGDSGQLFSISDSQSGTIFAVNDVSGIPSIEVLDTGTVKIAEYSGSVGIGLSTPTEILDVDGNVKANTFISTVTSGTAPFTVTSNTVVTNLNADLLDGQQGSYYLDWTNTTNKPDPVVTVTLTGDVTGSANTTLTDLASGTISVATTIATNSVALGTDTTGNYVATIGGTTNQVTVTGSGSESAAVTLSLPQNIHTAATPTFGSLTITNGVVINEGGGDNDTRIEGDTDENLLFVNAGTDRVGIGSNNPQGKFGVSRTTQANTLTHVGASLDVDTTVSNGIETLTALRLNRGILSQITCNAKTSGNFDYDNYAVYGLVTKNGAHNAANYGNSFGVYGRVNVFESNTAGYKNIDAVTGTFGQVSTASATNTAIRLMSGVTGSVSSGDTVGTTITNMRAVTADLRPLGANTTITDASMFYGTLGGGNPTANVSNVYGVYIANPLNHWIRGSIKLGSSGTAPTGTTASDVTLDLSEGDSATLRLTSTDSTGSLDQMIGQIQFYGSDADSPGAGVKSKIASYMTPAAGDGSYLTFSTSDGATNDIERVRILSSGNVGIATNAPDEKLHIIGNTKANTFISTVTSGTAPFTVTSNTVVTNLNADLLDGNHSSAFYLATNPNGYITSSESITLTNKTLTDPALIGTILEDVYTISDGAAFEIDPGNGSIQLITLGANRTPKATNFAAGEAITLMVDDGSAYALTWTDATWGGSGVVWSTDGGDAPTLATTGYTTIVLWKVSTQVYGARVGDV